MGTDRWRHQVHEVIIREHYLTLDGKCSSLLCRAPWPCDTEKMRRAFDAERALADRLAGVLRRATAALDTMNGHAGAVVIGPSPALLAAANDALDSHKEARKLTDIEARPVDREALRMERGWPTPNNMRRTAAALDALTRPAKYGDVLRWVADACDADLSARQQVTSK